MAVEPAVTRGPDILTRTAPALSATSDMPLAPVAAPPASASNNAADQAAGTPAEMDAEAQAAARAAKQDSAPAPEAAPAVTPEKPETPAGEAEKPATEAAPDNTPAYVKREITKARNQQREAERVAAEAVAKADRAMKLVEELTARIPEPAPTPAVPRPIRDGFDSPDAYDRALETWASSEGERRATEAATAKANADKIEANRLAAEAAEAQRRTAVEAQVTQLNSEWQAKKAKAIEKYPDFVAVAESDDVRISEPMGHAIILAENGPEIAYHLGQNPEEAERIAALPNAVTQVIEIGKLAARLASPKATVSRAPRPMTPLNGGNAAADTSDREASMEEWAAKRTPEIQAARSPFISASNARH